MLTKYTLTIGTTEHEIPDECLKNWDEISFQLKRTDFSGVMRSYSTEFEFVGEIADMLWALYLADGYQASASVAVYTFTQVHTWSKQFEEALDFSSIEYEQGVLTINAFDNSLSAKIKAKKSQKYEFPMSSISDYLRLSLVRMEIKSYAHWVFTLAENDYSAEDYGAVCMRLMDNKSAVISNTYLEPFDESNGADGGADNSFFMKSHVYGATLKFHAHGYVRCYLDQSKYGESRVSYPHESSMQVMLNTEDEYGYNQRSYVGTVWTDDITAKREYGKPNVNMKYGGSDLDIVTSLAELEAYSGEKPVGFFGVVGEVNDASTQAYWDNNVVYEWNGTTWELKGAAKDYYQDRLVDTVYELNGSTLVMRDTYISLVVDKKMFLNIGSEEFYIHADWSDPVERDHSCRGVSPLVLGNKLIKSIEPTASVTIDADEDGLIAETALIPGEELRLIGGAKIYSTFQQFCEFMECVFGYTYAIEGSVVHFKPRAALFTDSVSKVVDMTTEAHYSVNDNIIYTTIEVGFAKKDYSEIDGRYEKNFMNYYKTGFNLTDKKYTLTSKYRADSYGIEFTIRKSVSSTTDNSADEDVFFVHYTTPQGYGPRYEPDDNDVFNPELCMERNAAFLAAMGNGAEVTFSMTSSDGDNALADVTVEEGDNLFTAGELEFNTDDMVMPADVNALVQLDHDGFRYQGYISEVKCRYGRLNGAEYKLIVKSIEEL